MDIEIGQSYIVIPTKILSKGAIVKLKDGTTQLIHISRISKKYIANVSDFVELGQPYEAIGVEGSAHPVELSLIHLNLKSKHSSSDSQSDKLKDNSLDFEAMLAKSTQDMMDKLKCIENNQRRYSLRKRR